MVLESLDQFWISSVWYNNHHKIFFKNNFSTHKALTTLFRHGFFGFGAIGGEGGLSGLTSRNWQMLKLKIGIKTNDNTSSIAQPYFADVTIFSPKKLLIFRYMHFWTRERRTIIFFAQAFMFSRSILASFTIHIGITFEKVYSVQLSVFR